MLIDIHSHLYNFTEKEIGHYLNSKNIGRIITCAYDKKSLELTIPLLKRYNNIYLSIGVHPQETLKKYDDFFKIMENLLNSYVSVGEIGYDNYPANPPLDIQKKVFIKQLKIAQNNNLPVIIHCRNAFDEIFADLQELNISVPVIFHSYSGGFKYLDIILKKNYYISFSGSLTYERAKKIKRIASEFPLNRILCETDCPYITVEKTPEDKKSNPTDIEHVYNSLINTRIEKDIEIIKRIEENNNKIFNFDKIDRNRDKWIKLLEKNLKD